MISNFGEILRSAVDSVPGAIGGAFAARDGETVDSYAASQDREEWALLTAHYGILLSHIQAWLHTRHYGSAEILLLSHERIDVLVSAVADGYFALIALERPAPLATAMQQLIRVAGDLREEMA